VADDTNVNDARHVGVDVRTFLIADMRGYTRFTREFGDQAASGVAARFAAIVRDAAPSFDGELLELRGDEAMCVFSSARQALRAAVEIQRRLRTPGGEGKTLPLAVGIGLDAGEAVPTEGGYRGSALNLAARLCSHAGGGEILATERLVGLCGPVSGLHWDRPRPLRLKGVQDPERVVRIESDEAIPPPPAPLPEAAQPVWRRRWLVAGVMAAAVVLVATVAVELTRGSHAAPVAILSHSLAVIDPRRSSGQDPVVSDVRLAGSPESLAAGFGRVWVGEQGGTVGAVRTANLRLQQPPYGVGIDPAFIAAGAQAVWVFDGLRDLVELNTSATSPGITARRRLWKCAPDQFVNPHLLPACGGGGVAVVNGQVWVGHAVDAMPDSHNGVVDQRSASTLRSVGSIARVAIGTFGVGEGGLWSFGGVGMETDRVDTATGQVTHIPFKSQIATYTGAGVAVGFGYAWAASPSGVLYRCSTDGTYTQFQLRSGITDITASPTALWVSLNDGRVLEIRPSPLKITRTIRLARKDAVALTYADGRVWVALA
jgi:class 3 adenylate cyclase